MTHLESFSARRYRDLFRDTLLNDILPFWLNHGMDREHGGIMTALDRDGKLLDSDKSIWFQGRTAWTYATAAKCYGQRPEWEFIAQSALKFIEHHAIGPSGKLFFTVTRTGEPLRMRRYVYSEAFAALGNSAMYQLTQQDVYRAASVKYLDTYLKYSFTPGLIPPKTETSSRPMLSLGPYMFALHLCGSIQRSVGDVTVAGRSCSEWRNWSADQIERLFYKPELSVLLETVGSNGEVLDHFDGRTLNPGHAFECAWFLMDEGRYQGRKEWIDLGCQILDCMWTRGWDSEFGGIYYFRDLNGGPVQDYWHDMKFWWPHCEAMIATLLAYRLTSRAKYLNQFVELSVWSFNHFRDREHGEWYGYLHRDGSPSVQLKGNMWKGPYHIPRMLWYCEQLLSSMLQETI